MKNILLLCEAYGGGVKTYIDTITMNNVQFKNIEFKMLISTKRLEKDDEINKDFIIEDNLSFGKSPLKLIKSLIKIHRVVKYNNIDIIHANSTLSGLLIYIYSYFNRQMSFIYTPHGYYSLKKMSMYKRKIVRFIERKINSICFKVIHVSNSEEKEAIKQGLVKKENSIVIFNGVADPKNDRKRTQNDLFTIVNLARVDDQKNPFEFIRLANYILKRNENIKFIWAGNGKYLEEAREKVKSIEMGSKIKFIGFSNQKSTIFSQVDAYLSTSYYEGLPFSIVEAMSYKLPLILSNIVGHSDMVNEDKNGILFEDNDYSTVNNFLQNITRNNKEWDHFSKNSYKLFQENFSVNLMLSKMEELYNEE